MRIFGGSQNDLHLLKQLMQTGSQNPPAARHAQLQIPKLQTNSEGQSQRRQSGLFNNQGANNQKPPIMGRTPSGVPSSKLSKIRTSNTFSKMNRNGMMHEPQNFEQLGKMGASKNDEEVRVEKALIELNEVKNDIIIQKNDDAMTEKINKTESKTQL